MRSTKECDERWEKFLQWARVEILERRRFCFSSEFYIEELRTFPAPRGVPFEIGRQIRPSGSTRPLYIVECECCKKSIVRTYDHVKAQARYGVGSLCRASDGIEKPCGKDAREARAAKVEVDGKVNRLIERVAERSRDRVALRVLLSKVKKRESYPLDWQDSFFWQKLAKRVIEDRALGYDVVTVEHMVAHARAAISAHENRTNHATESR